MIKSLDRPLQELNDMAFDAYEFNIYDNYNTYIMEAMPSWLKPHSDIEFKNTLATLLPWEWTFSGCFGIEELDKCVIAYAKKRDYYLVVLYPGKLNIFRTVQRLIELFNLTPEQIRTQWPTLSRIKFDES